MAIAAWISQLSLKELSNDPDSNSQARYFSLPSLWILFSTAIFALVIPLLLGLAIAFSLILAGFYLKQILFQSIFSSVAFIFARIGEDVIQIILGLAIILLCCLIAIWFYVRFFITDLVFAVEKIEKTFTVFNIIKQSYLLTKDSKLKIFWTIGLSFVVTVPIWSISYFLVSIFSAFVLIALDTITPSLLNADNLYFYLGLYVLICWTLVVNLLVMPFWQSLKAVIFYQSTRQDNWDLISNHHQN